MTDSIIGYPVAIARQAFLGENSLARGLQTTKKRSQTARER
jgi:hypothetical protein